MAFSHTDIQGRFVVVEGARIYYEEVGRGVPLVCIHTAGACSLEYYRFLPLMADHGLRAIALDLPGHGKSHPVNWQPFRVMREYAECVWKVVQVICPGEKPVITGCSIGGNMALDLACHHSDGLRAAVVLEGAAVTPMIDVQAYEEPHACPGWQNVMERVAVASMYHPAPKDKALELRWLHRYTSQQVATGDLQCWVNHDVREKLKDIRCPVLCLAGEADFFVPEAFVDSTVAGIPDGLAEKRILRKMGHYPMFEQPEALAEVFLDFLKRRKVI